MAGPGWLHRGPGVWLVVLLLATTGVAAGAEPSPADKETARTLFRQGDERYRAGDYAAALEAFTAADEIMRVPTTGLERGRTLVQLDRLLEAAEIFEQVVRMPKQPGENSVQQRARDDAARLLVTTRPLIPSLLIRIQGVSEQAEVQLEVDGVDVPEAARRFPRKVDPGRHEVKVNAQGYRSEVRAVELVEGQQAELTVALRPFDGSGSADDWAEPDGEESDGLEVPVVSWIGFGLAAAGLGVGVGFGAATLGNVSSLEDECGGKTCPPDKAGDIDEATTLAHVSTAGFVVAGVGAAVGVLFVLLDGGDDEEPPEATWVPQLGPGFVGVLGTF